MRRLRVRSPSTPFFQGLRAIASLCFFVDLRIFTSSSASPICGKISDYCIGSFRFPFFPTLAHVGLQRMLLRGNILRTGFRPVGKVRGATAARRRWPTVSSTGTRSGSTLPWRRLNTTSSRAASTPMHSCATLRPVASPTSCVHTWRRCCEKTGQGRGCLRQATASECRQESQSPVPRDPRILRDGATLVPACQFEACKPICAQRRADVPGLECTRVSPYSAVSSALPEIVSSLTTIEASIWALPLMVTMLCTLAS